MEYDDSDFGNQKPQVNSEGITKSSPVLSTYSLPKFDFDDSLPGDIRFDSLVETGTFRGIGSQEDTSWIEDFSRGSSRIEFSSQASESASISRRNDVWSEATSVESVDMLLKSVGQEDIIRGETEAQNSGSVGELGSSRLQLTLNEEDKDHLNMKDDEDTVSVPGKLSDSGNNIDILLQEIDVKTFQCTLAKDTEIMSTDDNSSIDEKHDSNQIKADTLLERALHEDIRAPVLEAESHAKCPKTLISLTENLSSGLHQINDNCNKLIKKIQSNCVRDLSEGLVEPIVDGIDHTALGKDMQTVDYKPEGQTAEGVTGDLEDTVSLELDTNSGGELGAIGTDNNYLKKPFGSSTAGHHDHHSAELCFGQVGSSSPSRDCNCEIDSHVDANACEGSTVILEGGSAFLGDSSDVSSLNPGDCCDGKILSDRLVTGSSGVHSKNEFCGSPKQNETPEEFLPRENEICGAGVEEDGLGGCTEKMEKTVALKKPENSLTENDKILRISRGEMDGKLANDNYSLSVVRSSTVLETASHASEDLCVRITPAVYEGKFSKGVNISSSTTIDKDSMETTAGVDLSYVNDKCKDAIINVQSNSKCSNADDKNCSTSGLLTNDIVVGPPLESVCNTQNEGTPCESPSAISAASVRDSEEPKVSPSSINCCSEICKDDTETEDSIKGRLDRSGASCFNTGSLIHDGSNPQNLKASDAADNDKTFSFMVASSAEHSERETVKLWQPFASEVPQNSQKNVEDSPSTPGMEKISLINLGSHQTTDEKLVPDSKSTSKRKPRRTPVKTTKESTKRGSSQKPTTPSKLKESSVLQTVVSGLPDLNHASSLPTVRPQHFNDLQQLQLRAQIFVYGSLIQGTAPDEACMVAAFGGPDGGRSIWETAQRRCLERIQDQKSQNSNPGTPFQQHSSSRTADQKDKTSKYQNKSSTTTPGKASKSTPTHTTINHLAPPASPLWTMHTPNRVHFSGMCSSTVLEHNGNPQSYSHSSSPMTSTVVHTSSWFPHPAPWVALPQTTALKASPPPSMHTKMELVKLTPVRESSVSEISVRHTPTSLVAHPSGPTNVPSPLIEDTTSNLNTCQTPSDPKPRKRKKSELIKASMPMVDEPPHQVELVSAACVSSILPDSSSFTLPSASDPFTEHTTKGNKNVGDRIMMSEDMCSKMNEAKLSAEDAAARAVAAVDCSQEMWSQLAKQKDSGLLPDVEAKVASAALAVAAAVAVAKAAAAAAKVAYNAAIQARLMAEEAMNSSRTSFVDSSSEVSLDSSVNNLGNAMVSSVLKGENLMNCSSISGGMLIARENIESVSAASKRAENMDAIVKASELAAEAVTQAGKVAAMGDAITLSDLATAGPEGCWELPKLTFERELQSDTVIERHMVGADRGANTSKSVLETIHIRKQTTDDRSMDLIPDYGCKPTSMDLSNKVKKAVGTAEAIPIKEGSFVEIYKEGDAIKAAWFPACVLELKNGEVYVCYTENPPTGSSGELKEWIRLDIQENEAPKIRPAHPLRTMPADGTRKRRREAMGKCSWSVGDRVDAWRQNCWWEGIISEKCSKDDTSFTVHFSAQGETSIIKACHLRPSLIWQDGQWVECSSSVSYDGCIRQEKRMKLYDLEHEVEKNEMLPVNVDTTRSKMHGESRLLGLSDNEKTFDVGKSSKHDKVPVRRRTGLQNEGKKVNFGVPRPGKNTKFMDVSQHYVLRDSKMNEGNDSTRWPKIQGSGLPVWKTSTRIDMHEKKVSATQLRVPNFRKPTAVPDRILGKNSESSEVSHNENAFRSQGMTGFATFSSIGRAQNAPFGFSSASKEQSSKMFTSTSSKSELASKSKIEPPVKKLGIIEEDKVYNRTAGTSVSEGVEPRRSNRRIQPTSRLLEGLQTSLSIPKVSSSSSHGKGVNRSASSRGNL